MGLLRLPEIARRLAWHAGLSDGLHRTGRTVSEVTAPGELDGSGLTAAVGDCLNALDALNRELNPPDGELGRRTPDLLPRELVYAVTEVVRLIRARHASARGSPDADDLFRAAWSLETAWSAVLAGDVEDLDEHLKLEWGARSVR